MTGIVNKVYLSISVSHEAAFLSLDHESKRLRSYGYSVAITTTKLGLINKRFSGTHMAEASIYAHTPIRTAENWKFFFPENIFIIKSGLLINFSHYIGVSVW